MTATFPGSGRTRRRSRRPPRGPRQGGTRRRPPARRGRGDLGHERRLHRAQVTKEARALALQPASPHAGQARANAEPDRQTAAADDDRLAPVRDRHGSGICPPICPADCWCALRTSATSRSSAAIRTWTTPQPAAGEIRRRRACGEVPLPVRLACGPCDVRACSCTPLATSGALVARAPSSAAREDVTGAKSADGATGELSELRVGVDGVLPAPPGSPPLGVLGALPVTGASALPVTGVLGVEAATLGAETATLGAVTSTPVFDAPTLGVVTVTPGVVTVATGVVTVTPATSRRRSAQTVRPPSHPRSHRRTAPRSLRAATRLVGTRHARVRSHCQPPPDTILSHGSLVVDERSRSRLRQPYGRAAGCPTAGPCPSGEPSARTPRPAFQAGRRPFASGKRKLPESRIANVRRSPSA